MLLPSWKQIDLISSKGLFTFCFFLFCFPSVEIVKNRSSIITSQKRLLLLVYKFCFFIFFVFWTKVGVELDDQVPSEIRILLIKGLLPSFKPWEAGYKDVIIRTLENQNGSSLGSVLSNKHFHKHGLALELWKCFVSQQLAEQGCQILQSAGGSRT